MIESPNALMLEIGKYIPFYKRFIIKLIWILSLSIILVVPLYIKDGVISLYFTIPVSLIISIIGGVEIYQDRFLLIKLALDKKSKNIQYVVEDWKENREVLELKTGYYSIEISPAYLGQVTTPNYVLRILDENRNVLFKQRNNMIWSTDQIKEFGIIRNNLTGQNTQSGA